MIGVGVYHGAYISEVIRTGIEAIPRGQSEAAASQGFSYLETMYYIILPQTIRIIMPPLANQALNLVKNTSILAMVAGMDLMYYQRAFIFYHLFSAGTTCQISGDPFHAYAGA